MLEVQIEDLMVVIKMEGQAQRSRTVSTAGMKLFHVRPATFRHPMKEEFE